MNSENYWNTLLRINDGVSDVRERLGRIEGALPNLATRDEVSQVFDAKISTHFQQCKARSSKTSIIPKPTDWSPVVKAVSKVLLALAGLIAAATAAWFAAR